MSEYEFREKDPNMMEIAALRAEKTDEELDAEFEEEKKKALEARNAKEKNRPE